LHGTKVGTVGMIDLIYAEWLRMLALRYIHW
jgi:hypothetical protein